MDGRGIRSSGCLRCYIDGINQIKEKTHGNKGTRVTARVIRDGGFVVVVMLEARERVRGQVFEELLRE